MWCEEEGGGERDVFDGGRALPADAAPGRSPACASLLTVPHVATGSPLLPFLQAHDIVARLLASADPEVRGAACFALGALIPPTLTAPPSLLPSSVRAASKDSAFAGRGLDPLYLTTAPGARFADFHELASNLPAGWKEQVSAYDEANRDVFSIPEVTETALIMNQVIGDTVTKRITIPVLMVEGAQDKNYCLQNKLITAIGQDCSSDEAYYNAESKYFTGSPNFQAFVVKDYGHSFNFSPNAPQQWHQRMVDWARGRGF